MTCVLLRILNKESSKIMIASRYSAARQRFYGFSMLGIMMCVGLLKAQATDYPRRIVWQAKARTFHTVNSQTITQPTFTNARHMDQYDLLPFYSEFLPATAEGDVSAQITNAVYSAAEGLDKNSAKYIPANITVEATMSYYKKRPSIYVQLLPFRKNPSTGAIERLESFTLKVTVNPKPQLRGGTVYKANSVLASGTWYKVAVDTDGIFKIDYNFVKNTLGIDPSTINLSTLAIFGNGGGMVPDLVSLPRPDDLIENPTMLVDNNGNGKFDNGDYLLFYAQDPDMWQFDSVNKRFYHTKNLYASQTYYFLTTDAGTGKRVSLSTGAVSSNQTISVFDDRAFHEADQVNLLQSGKIWLGDEMTGFNPTASFSYYFPNMLTTSPVGFSSSFAANAANGSNTAISINGSNVLNQYVTSDSQNDGYPDAWEWSATNAATYLSNSPQLNIIYNFSPINDNGTAVAYIYYFELNVQRALTLNGNYMPFRSIASIGTSNVSNFQLSNANNNTQVWDITNIGNIQQMQGTLNTSNGVFSFSTPTPSLKEFVAFNSNASFSNPIFIAPVENQNLHAVGQPNMIIVTYDDFVAPSNDLADFHRTYDNISVSVVKTSQIFNEFGSGKPDISAIRDFVEMIYNRAGYDTTQMPQYLLLMGDGSFDPKNRVPDNGNFISAYESYNSNNPLETYVSDDFFGLLDPGDGGYIENASQLLDIGVGRIPADAESDAWNVVNKIKSYKRPQPCVNCIAVSNDNSWRNIQTFVAGSGESGNTNDGPIFVSNSDALAESTRATYPVYNYDKIYCTAYPKESTPSGDRYPDVNTAILNKINTGTLLMNYIGHGGPTNWAQERIFNLSDIISLQNGQKLPLFITATCDFSAYDLPTRTAGEWLIVNGAGGGIASITTVRTVFEDGNQSINVAVFNYLFALYQNRYPRLGEVTMLSKNYCMKTGVDPTNTRKFTMLGDPAMTLDYPEYNVVTTQINGKSISQPHDTLKALTHMTIKGEVRDNNGNKMNSFNGTIYPTVYDKISNLSTIAANDPNSSVVNFQEYNSIIFKGKASVVNGSFSFSFVVPKDINYQYGKGRISYYADNGNFVDAHGYDTSIVIGGSADTASLTHAGPVMKLYMNDANFVSGGITNSNPVLLVNLQDEGGINTVGNGIGHDLTAILDNNNQNPIILNDYYQSNLDDFTKGSIKYPFTNLAAGNHTLQVKAWDIYNNSTVGYIEFNVTINTQLALNHVYNYPNPFTTHTQFMFEHNRPFDNLDVSVQIFSVAGRMVKSIVQQVQTSGYRVDNIEWDGLDDYGDPIGKGVYIYKLTVRDSNGSTANKFEKLVLFR